MGSKNNFLLNLIRRKTAKANNKVVNKIPNAAELSRLARKTAKAINNPIKTNKPPIRTMSAIMITPNNFAVNSEPLIFANSILLLTIVLMYS